MQCIYFGKISALLNEIDNVLDVCAPNEIHTYVNVCVLEWECERKMQFHDIISSWVASAPSTTIRADKANTKLCEMLSTISSHYAACTRMMRTWKYVMYVQLLSAEVKIFQLAGTINVHSQIYVRLEVGTQFMNDLAFSCRQCPKIKLLNPRQKFRFPLNSTFTL